MNAIQLTRRGRIRGAAAFGVAGTGSAFLARQCGSEEAGGARAIDIGSRRELFIDGALIERLAGKAEQRLHRPAPREIALVHDEPWEGTGSGYHSVFQDGDQGK